MKEMAVLSRTGTRSFAPPLAGWRCSLHAGKRLQQRGIPVFIVEMLVRFGDREHDGHGARQLYFGKRSKRRLRSYLGPEIYRWLAEYLDVYAVLAGDEVITAGYRTKRIRRH